MVLFIILKQGRGKGYLRRLDRKGKVYFLLFIIMEGRWREGGISQEHFVAAASSLS